MGLFCKIIAVRFPAMDRHPNLLSVKTEPFGVTPQGEAAALYTLTNRNGISVSITSYGALIVGILTPDRDGKLEDIALGFPSLEGYFSPQYLTELPHFGATIGRFANRIGAGVIWRGDRIEWIAGEWCPFAGFAVDLLGQRDDDAELLSVSQRRDSRRYDVIRLDQSCPFGAKLVEVPGTKHQNCIASFRFHRC